MVLLAAEFPRVLHGKPNDQVAGLLSHRRPQVQQLLDEDGPGTPHHARDDMELDLLAWGALVLALPRVVVCRRLCRRGSLRKLGGALAQLLATGRFGT